MKNKKVLAVILAMLLLSAMGAGLAVPASAAIVTTPKIACGDMHTLVLKRDGTVWAFGANNHGQLGCDTALHTQNTPVQVNNLSDVVDIGAGYWHSVALKQDGTVWAWGYNITGQLGNGTLTDSTVPTQVRNLSGITAISVGIDHALALKNDGTVWGFGYSQYYALGDGVPVYAEQGYQINGISGINAIAAGYQYSLALGNDGTIWGLGFNQYYQLGNGSTATANSPAAATNFSGAARLGGGYYNSYAIKADGTLWGCGLNSFSNASGDGSTGYVTELKHITALNNINSVAGGYQSVVALQSNGTVWGWGRYVNGNGSNSGSTTPVAISGFQGAVAVDTAKGGISDFGHTIVIKNDGSVWGAGSGNAGQLGDGTYFRRTTPVRAVGQGGSGYFDVNSASLSAQYTVSFNANGGTGAPGNQTKTQGQSLALSNTAPARGGYDFLGWARTNDATGAEYQPGGQYAGDMNTTLYAVWKQNTVPTTTTTTTTTTVPTTSTTTTTTTTVPTTTTTTTTATTTTTTAPTTTTTTPTTQPPPTKGIFGTNAKWYGAWWHYLLFFIGFGFIWMWF